VTKLWRDIERFYSFYGHRGPVSGTMLFTACFNPRMVPVVVVRLAEYFHDRRLRLLAKFFSSINVLVFGIEVSPQVKIGGGLFLPHTVGTVIGAARIGDNCTIMQGVTLGASEPEIVFTAAVRPVIGNDVFIGAGAKVIGSVTVGDHSKIGANAVVLRDIPAHAVAVGVPAVVVVRPTSEEVGAM